MRLYLLCLIFVSCSFLIMGCNSPEFMPRKYNMGDCVTIIGSKIEGRVIGHRYRYFSEHDYKNYNYYAIRYFTDSNEAKTIRLFEKELSDCS